MKTKIFLNINSTLEIISSSFTHENEVRKKSFTAVESP